MSLFLGFFAELREATISSSCLSVRPYRTTQRILTKFDILNILQNLSRTFKFHSNLTKVTGSLHEDRCNFIVLSGWIFFLELEMFMNVEEPSGSKKKIVAKFLD